MKMAVSLIVLLAVASIFIYKAAAAKDNASDNAKNGAAFAFAQAAITGSRPSATATPGEATTGQRIGEYLESFADLNKVAADQDAVFVFIPAPKNDPADEKTNTALLAAQRTLKSNKVTLGLYTLSTGSPDYSPISAQVRTPAIVVAYKGKGMAAVSGDVTEQKLLQAFVASSSAGCGPSGCAPSSAQCP